MTKEQKEIFERFREVVKEYDYAKQMNDEQGMAHAQNKANEMENELRSAGLPFAINKTQNQASKHFTPVS